MLEWHVWWVWTSPTGSSYLCQLARKKKMLSIWESKCDSKEAPGHWISFFVLIFVFEGLEVPMLLLLSFQILVTHWKYSKIKIIIINKTMVFTISILFIESRKYIMLHMWPTPPSWHRCYWHSKGILQNNVTRCLKRNLSLYITE